MTSEQATIGRGVVYQAHPEARPEDGVITSVHAVGQGIVHVLYDGDGTAKATRLVDLETVGFIRRHVYDGERCIHCGVNVYDCDHENDECCNERDPIPSARTIMITSVADGEEAVRRATLAALADFLDADQISTIINESLMGYAPGTTDNVRNGTWNAFDDEIDTDAIARYLRARLLGETTP